MATARNLEHYLINREQTLKEALEKLNSNSKLTLFIVDAEQRLIGTITDGDVRRGLLDGLVLQDPVYKFMHSNFRFLRAGAPDLAVIESARKSNLRVLPILDDASRLLDVLDLRKTRSMLPVEALLMAGGRGERLRPLTDKTPKPLLKIGEKAIIEYNLENLSRFGVRQVHISVKYLAEQIVAQLGDGSKYELDIAYLREEQPLGTMGSATLLKEVKADALLVMNSDLFTNIDMEEFYLHFLNSGADMAVATFPYVVSVPYGVMNTEESFVTSFSEKPTYTYFANAGIYLIKKECLGLIPKDTFFNATDLMEVLLNQGKKITNFHIVGYWIDIGKPDDYKKAQEYVKYLNK